MGAAKTVHNTDVRTKATLLSCPFLSSSNFPVLCREGCALFVVRQNTFGQVRFVGCALRWLGVQSVIE